MHKRGNASIEIDPMGMVIYGDTQLFSVKNKLQLLDALRLEAEKTDYLRQNGLRMSLLLLPVKICCRTC